MQLNTRKVPSLIKRWREGHDRTHAVMATALIKKDRLKKDTKNSLTEAAASVQS